MILTIALAIVLAWLIITLSPLILMLVFYVVTLPFCLLAALFNKEDTK